jgi:uncharacterized Tic20 family protein
MHETSTSSGEERTFAALAHIGIVANPFNLLGVIGAVLIWATQHRHSRYVADHALQALIFQILAVCVTVGVLLMWGGCLLVSLLPALIRPELYPNELPLTFRVVLFAGVLILVFVAVCVGYGVAGALAAWQGRMFRYAMVNSLLGMRQKQQKPKVSRKGRAANADDTATPEPSEQSPEAQEPAPADPADTEQRPQATEHPDEHETSDDTRDNYHI